MQPENCKIKDLNKAEEKIREANTGRSEPQNRYSRNHFAQASACTYPLFLYDPYGQDAKVFYRKPRDGSVCDDTHVHIHIHMPATERSKGQAVPKWALKKEREHEASNPGPDHEPSAGSTSEVGCTTTKLNLEGINVSSVATNGRAIWEREAHVQLILETLVPPDAVGTYQQQAKGYNKVLEVGPLDPEQNKAAAGVGIAAVTGLRPYKLPNPTEDMQDAEATGRCAMYCIDLAGHTLAIAVIYGYMVGLVEPKGAQKQPGLMTFLPSSGRSFSSWNQGPSSSQPT